MMDYFSNWNPNGISGNLLRLLQYYLSNRKQQVVLKVSYSDYSSIESGVSQGSVLDPLLFLVSIIDNDAMLISIIKNPEISSTDLNHDLTNQWADQWKLESSLTQLGRLLKFCFLV